MVRLRCDCGAEINVSETALGRDVRCPRCRRVHVAAATLDLGAPADAVDPTPAPRPPAHAPRPRPGRLEAPTLPYATAPDAASPTGEPGAARGLAIPALPFWRDGLASFLYPAADAENALTFGVVAVISLLRIPLAFGMVFGLLGQAIITGWLCSIYLRVVAETCAGDDGLPGFKMEGNVFEDVVRPALRFAGTFAIAMLPATALWLLLWFGYLSDTLFNDLQLLAWLGLGAFFWPLILIVVALEAPHLVVRIDLLARTALRTIGAYLAIWLLLLAAGAMLTLTSYSFLLRLLSASKPPAFFSGSSLSLRALSDVLGTYLVLVAMRIIGLYYRHFRGRFAFELE